MPNTEIARRFDGLENKMSLDEYNFEHFRTKHLLSDAKATVKERGIKPGEMALDFEMLRVGGGSLRLSELRGKPVILHFGSFS